jgi:hypothetical protein
MRASPSTLLRFRFPALPGIDPPRVPLRVLLHTKQIRPEPEFDQLRRLGIGQYHSLASLVPNHNLAALFVEHRVPSCRWRRRLHASGLCQERWRGNDIAITFDVERKTWDTIADDNRKHQASYLRSTELSKICHESNFVFYVRR